MKTLNPIVVALAGVIVLLAGCGPAGQGGGGGDSAAFPTRTLTLSLIHI